jgi:hypothetical protein
MNIAVLKALVALLPAAMLFSGSAVLFVRGKSGSSLLQLLRRGVPGGGRLHSYLRSARPVSMDALGSQ